MFYALKTLLSCFGKPAGEMVVENTSDPRAGGAFNRAGCNPPLKLASRSYTASLVQVDRNRCDKLGSDEEPEQGAERRGGTPEGAHRSHLPAR